MSKKNNDKKWVVYPIIPLTIDDIKKRMNMQENNELLPEVENIVETTQVEDIQTIEDNISDAEIVDDKELTDEEKKKFLIEHIKKARLKFKPIKNGVKTTVIGKTRLGGKIKSKDILTNVTTNQFDATYKKKRAKKNKAAKASRRANRN